MSGDDGWMIRRGQRVQGPASLAVIRRAAAKQSTDGFEAMHELETLGEWLPLQHVLNMHQASAADLLAPTVSSGHKRCKYCNEPIAADAIKCKHCGEFQTRQRRDQLKSLKEDANRRGIAAVLSLIVPGAGQMFRGRIGVGFIWLFAVVIGYFAIIPGLILHVLCVYYAYQD